MSNLVALLSRVSRSSFKLTAKDVSTRIAIVHIHMCYGLEGHYVYSVTSQLRAALTS